MTKLITWPKLIGASAFLPFALPLFFLSPAFAGLGTIPILDLADCLGPLARTLIFSFVTAIVGVPLSFAVGVVSWRYRSNRLSWSAVWLVPILGGSVIWAFVWKLVIFRLLIIQHLFANRSPTIVWPFLGLMQLWEFCPAFAFLYWANLNVISPVRLTFAEAEGRSFEELLRDVLWPQCRSLTTLIVLFYCGQTFQEYAKLQIVFRPSQSTKTELISHYLARYLETYLPANARAAITDTLAIGVLVGFVGVIGAYVTSAAVRRSLSMISDCFVAGPRTSRRWDSVTRDDVEGKGLVLFLYSCIVLAPFGGLATIRWLVDRNLLVFALRAAIAALLCCMVVAGISFYCAAGLRLAWPDRFTAKSHDIAVLAALALCEYFIPAICISLLAFYWLPIFAPSVPGSVTTVIAWFSGEFLWAFPLLTIFLVQTNSRIKGSELSYLHLYRATSTEIVRDSFWKRMTGEYVLLFSFAFSIILTESTLNSITSSWSTRTPAIATALLHLLEGRAGSYGAAASLCLFALLPIVVTVGALSITLRQKSVLHGSENDAEN